MPQAVLAQEPIIRAGAFLAVLLVMAAWEVAAPRRRNDIPRLVRWTNNLGLVAFDTALIRLVFPVLAVGLAVIAEERGWGLMNTAQMPPAVAFIAAILLLDFAIYLQHVLFHAVPAFWRLHRVHHSDTGFDASTGVRFHPLEILLSMTLKLSVVAAIGAPPVAVMAFEILLSATSLFNHANIRLPSRVDAVLRWIVVTPDMHRVHHSVRPTETNSNFGFNLPWWDRLLGTYRAQPRDGHRAMKIGLNAFRSPRAHWLDRLLVQPFRGKTGRYPLGGGPDAPE